MLNRRPIRTLLVLTWVVLTWGCHPAANEEGLTARECTDGEDNDGDGDEDCDDDGCQDYSVCRDDASVALLINELQASNTSTTTDESGAWPDWIELFNYSDEPIDLNGYTITDDLADPRKTELSGLIIDANSYQILWVDGDVEDGDQHLPFRLDADGEDVGLYTPDGEALTELSYGPQRSDWSLARVPDASSDWQETSLPTPGATNLGSE